VSTRNAPSWVDGDPTNNGGYGGGYSPTFSEMQQAGRPRPPAPQYGRVPTSVVGSDAPGGSQVPRNPALRPPGATSDGGGGSVSPPFRSPLTPPSTAIGDPMLTQPGYGAAPATGAPGSAGAPAGTGESDFEKALRERYQSNPSAPHFTGAGAQTAAEFVPGANPFQPSGGGSGSGLNPAIEQNVMELLKNPSGYTTDAATSTFNRLGGAIDDQFNVDNQKINEDMARRGIPVSTIAGGRLFDSNVARKSAKEDLAGRILTDQASTLGSDRARAIATASGYGNDQFSNALNTFLANRGSDSQTFNEGEQKLHDYTDFGQQGFSNSLATQQANNQQQQQMMQMLLQLFGGTGGGGTS
jgi:hypothetical protein